MKLSAITLRSIADALEKIEKLGSIGIQSITIESHVITLKVEDSQMDGRTVYAIDIKPQFSERN